MYIYTSIIGEEISHETESLIDHRDEAIGSLPPRITIGEFLKYCGRFCILFITYLDLHREVSSNIERRIDIDELDASLRLYLLSQRSVLQT